MRRAVYFPHTQIRDERFLKASLLLWDQVDFVAPVPRFQFDDAPKEHIDALELLCRPHVPSEREKAEVHRRVLNLLQRPLPQWLVTTEVPESIIQGRRIREFNMGYGMYPEKLAPKTWHLLEAAGLVKLAGPDEDYYARPLTGFLLMSLLADACAGESKEKITDRADAYQFMWKMVAAEQQDVPKAANFGAQSAAQSGLVNIAIRTVRTDDIPLENILAMRRREVGEAGFQYRRFRENFAAKIRDNATKAVLAKSLEERRDVAADFEREMRDDLAALKHELGGVKRKLVFSKEVVGLFSLGALVGDVTGVVGAATGAVQTVDSFSRSYAETLGKHPISYLYLGERPTLRNVPFGSLGLRLRRERSGPSK